MSENGLWGRLYVTEWSEREAFNTPKRGRPGEDFILTNQEYEERTEAVRIRTKRAVENA